jgi:hypothetical protein
VLVASIGEVISVDMNNSNVYGGNICSVLGVAGHQDEPHSIFNNQARCETLVITGVKYEKVPHYCVVCVLLGHVQGEWGTSENSLSEVIYFKWMLADMVRNHAQLYGIDKV